LLCIVYMYVNIYVYVFFCAMFSFSSQVVGKVQHGRLSKYFFENLEDVFPAGKVVTAKILRSVDSVIIRAVLLCLSILL